MCMKCVYSPVVLRLVTHHNASQSYVMPTPQRTLRTGLLLSQHHTGQLRICKLNYFYCHLQDKEPIDTTLVTKSALFSQQQVVFFNLGTGHNENNVLINRQILPTDFITNEWRPLKRNYLMTNNYLSFHLFSREFNQRSLKNTSMHKL